MTETAKKVALVTGASRGIGQAIAKALAKEGYYVLGTATTEKGAAAISALFKEAHLRGEGLVLDVTKEESLTSLMKVLEEQAKLPAILVNNAGITMDNLLLRMDDEEWFKVLETNLTALFRMTKAFLKPMFRARWGRIINLGSVVGSTGNAGQANYTAAKAGIIGFTKSLAQEMASRGITANVVAPGFIETDMTESLPDLVKEKTLERIPMKRMGKPEDIAAVVAFLASEQANYITGQTIHVNGGMFMSD